MEIWALEDAASAEFCSCSSSPVMQLVSRLPNAVAGAITNRAGDFSKDSAMFCAEEIPFWAGGLAGDAGRLRGGCSRRGAWPLGRGGAAAAPRSMQARGKHPASVQAPACHTQGELTATHHISQLFLMWACDIPAKHHSVLSKVRLTLRYLVTCLSSFSESVAFKMLKSASSWISD